MIGVEFGAYGLAIRATVGTGVAEGTNAEDPERLDDRREDGGVDSGVLREADGHKCAVRPEVLQGLSPDRRMQSACTKRSTDRTQTR